MYNVSDGFLLDKQSGNSDHVSKDNELGILNDLDNHYRQPHLNSFLMERATVPHLGQCSRLNDRDQYKSEEQYGCVNAQRIRVDIQMQRSRAVRQRARTTSKVQGTDCT